MLDKIKHYFGSSLWNLPLSQEKGGRRFWIKWIRISYLSVRGFYQDKCSLSASSLTYYTLMSIVPVFAMAFAIARGFGYHEVLKHQLLNRFQNQNMALNEAFKYSDTFLAEMRGGLIAGIGLAILFLTVALLISNLEAILNQIWRAKNFRTWQRILGDYFALILVGPVFFIIASSTTVFVVDRLEILIKALPFPDWTIHSLSFLANLIPYCLFWIFFTFIYLFIPNTKVRLRSASLAGLFTGSVYVVVQWAYIIFQVGVNKRYGAIYGSMAALPLFLIWVQVSWLLLLFGAEICWAHQTLNEHEFEEKASHASHSFKRLLSLWIVHLALKTQFLTLDLLIQKHQIPAALAMPILKRLVDAELLYEARGGYVPAVRLVEMKIFDVVEVLESQGENDFPFIEAKSLEPFEKALKNFSKQIESSPQNIRLSHVSNTL